jgi:hypothetical protein
LGLRAKAALAQARFATKRVLAAGHACFLFSRLSAMARAQVPTPAQEQMKRSSAHPRGAAKAKRAFILFFFIFCI